MDSDKFIIIVFVFLMKLYVSKSSELEALTQLRNREREEFTI
jgi:hypothetical protein